MLIVNRKNIAEHIAFRLNEEKELLKKAFQNSQNPFGYFFLDNLLPEKLANALFNSFPDISIMNKRNNIRENKYYLAQMDKVDEIIEETIFAFHDQKIIKIIEDICGLSNVHADTELYAGGISTMNKNQFLNPHLDNSHDKSREKWRILNLLYYITPNWKIEYGGNLELWKDGLKKEPTTIHSKFNRLVIMTTNKYSWHSVSRIRQARRRCCISNYYFSNNKPFQESNFHITSFRGRPNQKIRDILLLIDNTLRICVRKIFPFGFIKTKHFNNIK